MAIGAAASTTGFATGVTGFSRGSQALADTAFRLASGNRFTRDIDETQAAGATNLTAHSASFRQGLQKNNESSSALQVASNALTRISDLLTTQRNYAVQAADAGTSANDRALLAAQSQDVLSQIATITSGTRFNGKALLDGTASLGVETGDAASSIALRNVTQAALFSGGTPDLSTQAHASSAVTAIDAAIALAAKASGSAEGGLVRIDAAQETLKTGIAGQQNGRAALLDADVRQEAITFAIQQVTQKASTAVVAQAQQLNSNLLDLVTVQPVAVKADTNSSGGTADTTTTAGSATASTTKDSKAAA